MASTRYPLKVRIFVRSTHGQTREAVTYDVRVRVGPAVGPAIPDSPIAYVACSVFCALVARRSTISGVGPLCGTHRFSDKSPVSRLPLTYNLRAPRA